MKLTTQRALDRIIGASLCRVLSLFPWRYRRIPPCHKPRRILVILLSEMGSLVLAAPMFRLLRKNHPEASSYFLVFERNKGFLEMLDLVPKTRILILNDRSLSSFLISLAKVLIAFYRLKIDTVFDCELFSRISSILSLLSGAKVRVGFHRHTQEGLHRGGFINRPVPYSPYIHMATQFITMVECLEQREVPLTKKILPSPSIPDPGPLHFEPEEERRFHERFHEDFPQVDQTRLILVYPGGGLLPVRAWPLANYCDIVKDFTGKGYVVGVIGMESDRVLAEKICSGNQDNLCLNLVGYTKTVRELILLMGEASLLITNDGGPGHFACLSSVPSIVLYGPETPVLYGTLGRNAHFLYASLACSPCLTAYNHRKSPCDGDNACLKAISPVVVLEKAYDLLKNTGSSDRTHQGGQVFGGRSRPFLNSATPIGRIFSSTLWARP